MTVGPTILGELRPSQLLYTFGIGAVVDLPHISTMVMGLEDWPESHARPVREDRLLELVRRRLGPQVERLVAPPAMDDGTGTWSIDDRDAVGVPVAPFPRWLRCPACGLLAPLASRLFALRVVPGRPDRTRYEHVNCNQRRRPPPALPARFLLACEAGHLDDFPWSWFIHKGRRCNGLLELRELGVSGEAADVDVRCRECGAQRRMVDAFGREARNNLPGCRGRRPQLRDFEEQDCRAERSTILLGASNSWFPVTLSVLYVPPRPTDELDRQVAEHWALLGDVEDVTTVRFLRKQGELKSMARYDDGSIMAAIERRRAAPPTQPGSGDIKQPEWDAFSSPDGDLNGPDFRLREVAPPQRFRDEIERVVLVERLREVTALTAFTRISSPRDYAETQEIPSRFLAPISRQAPTFVPASEVRGEGVFILFDEARLAKWCRNNAAREAPLRVAHAAWRRRRAIEDPEAGFPGLRYVVLHSFAHALMRELALECGYNAASMRERIYARDAGGESPPMAGVLIYTAAPDAEGTLGGLVRSGEPDELGGYIRRALESMRLCSSDPLCADHRPEPDGSTLHGSACHACLFAPETSCERGNRYLDRSTLVETVGGDGGAFFGGQDEVAV